MPQKYKSAFRMGLFQEKKITLIKSETTWTKQVQKKTYGLNATLFKGALPWNKLPNYFKEAINPSYISKIKFGNRQGDRSLLYLLLNCFLLKKCAYVKKVKSVVIHLYF